MMVVVVSESEYQRVWMKKITSKRYAGQPTHEVSSRRFSIAGPIVAEKKGLERAPGRARVEPMISMLRGCPGQYSFGAKSERGMRDEMCGSYIRQPSSAKVSRLSRIPCPTLFSGRSLKSFLAPSI